MIEMLSKPIGEIGLGDIQALIDSEVPEGEQIEFKRELPRRKGNADLWASKNEIGDYARNGILEEAVAFANAYGGVLLLGIDESSTKPPAATAIRAIPRCEDLADRLKSMFVNCVEPQPVRFVIFGVPTEVDGSGVVIIRVGKSRLSPHRVTTTLACPVRRADQCRKMTMREIQDMTLNVSRGLQGLKERLSDRSERFQEEFGHLRPSNDKFGIRMTAVPVIDEIQLDRISQHGRLLGNLDTKWVTVAGGNDGRDLIKPPDFPPVFWRPLLRGARAQREISGVHPTHFSYREIYCDGLVEFGFVSVADAEHYLLCPDWPLVMFANLVAWADHFRRQADAPTVEYALEVETCNRGSTGFVAYRRVWPEAPRLPNTKFPTYPLNAADEITVLLARFYRDFWNSMGEDVGDVDFALRQSL